MESLAEYAWNGKLEKHDKNSAFAYRTVETDRTFTYDDAGKLLSATETESGCGTCVYTYEYDLMGNDSSALFAISRLAELLPTVKTNEAGTVVENRKYVYNESNQLSEAVLCDGKTTRKVQYTYDADGNLTGEYSPTDRSLTTYTYTVENRLEAVYTGTAYSQTLQMAAAYDGDGNRVYQLNHNPDKDEDLSDYYCSNNFCDYKGTGIRLRVEGEVSPAERELLSLINASGAVTDSSYELIEYINDVNREYTEVLVEQNINGTLDTAYVYGAAIGIGSDRLSLDRFDSSTGYYLYDPKGSVTGIINEEGQIYQSYRYSVFGEITFGASQYENEYTYNGESCNPNIKSQYLRARYYCVVTADFLTEDSCLGNIREPLTLNRYNYCVGNPVNYADPSGNKIFKDMWDGLRKWLFGDPDAPKPVTLNPQPITTPSPEPWLLPILEDEYSYLYEYGGGTLPAGGAGYVILASRRQFEEIYNNLQSAPLLATIPIEEQMQEANENGYLEECEYTSKYIIVSGYEFQYNWKKEGMNSTPYVSDEFLEKVVSISEDLQLNPDDMMAIMAFESWLNPKCGEGTGGAVGLIQFTNDAITEINKKNSKELTKEEILQMSAVEQLDIVYLYYGLYDGKVKDLADMYLTTLAPARLNGEHDSADTVVYSKEKHPTNYKYNEGLDINKDGIITKGEAVTLVIERREKYLYD